MATMPGFRKSLRCPGCANTTLAEFYEPAGAALCPRCGLVFFYDSLKTIGAAQAKDDFEADMFQERFEQLTRQIECDAFIKSLFNDAEADSLNLIELAMELEESGLTIEDLKAANVQTLEDLRRFMEERLE